MDVGMAQAPAHPDEGQGRLPGGGKMNPEGLDLAKKGSSEVRVRNQLPGKEHNEATAQGPVCVDPAGHAFP